MSTFHLRSLLVIPQIFLRTAVSKVFNFRFWFSFTVHVSELYSTIGWTNVWYKSTFVGLLISFAFHIHWGSSQCRLPGYSSVYTFLSQEPSWAITPPRPRNSSHSLNSASMVIDVDAASICFSLTSDSSSTPEWLLSAAPLRSSVYDEMCG